MPDAESSAPRVEVGRYARLAEARERGLVISALQQPHWIQRDGDQWVLWVEDSAGAEATRELAEFEAERAVAKAQEPGAAGKLPLLSLLVAAWVLIGFFFAQQMASADWEARGVAESRAILAGEWWRTITALTLHGDASHLAANLATGLFFAAFLLPRLGSGVTWLAILMTGALGNAINAWGYRGESHFSLGASTACFGALGMLVGVEFFARWRESWTRSRWQLILPLGAGLALLAFLGVGEEQRNVDYMAHFWGFCAGFAAGVLAEAGPWRRPISRRGQVTAAITTLALLAGAWLRAGA